MRYDSLPLEFIPLSGIVSYVVKRTHKEWSSSCPECGGVLHKNGEPPDRFRMLTKSDLGFPVGFCRNCPYRWYPHKGRKPSAEEVEYFLKQQREVEEERRQHAERALELLNNERIWEKFYAENNQLSMDTFRGWGVAESMIKYQQWGLILAYDVKSRVDGEWEHYYSPSASLPVWGADSVVQNVQLRVLSPRRESDRYRNYYEAGRSYLFVAYHDLPLDGTVVVCEGIKKAVVVAQALNNPNLKVVAIQSKKPSPEVLSELKDCGKVYICLDPDAFNITDKSDESSVDFVVRELGKERCLIMQLPCKADDGIVEHNLDPMKYIRMARKA